MILIDAIYINSDGGRVLLNYLILSLEKTKLEVFYLLDDRLCDNHQKIKSNKVLYLKASLFRRHRFYLKNRYRFSSVFCFGNLAPSLKLNAKVYTYCHNKLLLERSNELKIIESVKFKIKSVIFSYLLKNTEYIILQTQAIKDVFIEKHTRFGLGNILLIPFYAPFQNETSYSKIDNLFIYISSGVKYKNHNRLLAAFKLFYDDYKIGELHLTVTKNHRELYANIDKINQEGYPVINHKYLDRTELKKLYNKAEFLIYPSFDESFGLGIIEAIENNCKVIGADLPYTRALCIPSLFIDPKSINSIRQSFVNAVFSGTKSTEQLVFNEIDNLIEIISK